MSYYLIVGSDARWIETVNITGIRNRTADGSLEIWTHSTKRAVVEEVPLPICNGQEHVAEPGGNGVCNPVHDESLSKGNE